MDLGDSLLVCYSWMVDALHNAGKVVLDFRDETMYAVHYAVYDPGKLDEEKLRFVRKLEERAAEQGFAAN